MNIDEQLKELSQQTCPWQIDVEDRVMEQVRKHPYLQPVAPSATTRKYRWVPWTALTAAAAAVGLVVVNVNPAAATPNYNVDQIGTMVAYVSDYDNYYSSVEFAAENPIDYLYDEYENDN